MSKLKEILQQFEKALKSKASYETLLNTFRKIKSPTIIDQENLPIFFQIIYQLLDYQESEELYPGYTKGAHIRACAFSEIQATLLQKSSLHVNWNIQTANQYLQPFFQYLNKFEPNYYLEWKVFTKGNPVIKEVFENWLKTMPNQKKRPKDYLEGLKKALELEILGEKIKNAEIAWADLKDFLISSLDYPHFMVRAGAAKCLSKFYSDNLKYYPEGLLPFLDMLELIKQTEIKNSGVVGPFIDGYDDDCAGISSLKQNEEVINSNFNVTAWILNILENSQAEPGTPNAQPLDFYAHEYFEADPESLKKLIQMNREQLACESATNLNSRIEGMQIVLQKLANSQNQYIASNAKRHLQAYYP